jgi:hypothetical protein
MLHQKKTSLSDFASLNCCAAVVGGTLLALYRNTPAIWFAEKFPDHTNQSGCSLEMTCRIGAIQQSNFPVKSIYGGGRSAPSDQWPERG